MPVPEQHAPKAVERFVFFSDAVFAFALTLLATTVKLPGAASLKTNAAVLQALAQSLPAFSCYLASFVVVGSLWIRHHRIFEKLENYDKTLIKLNFLLLLCVSLVPFAVDVFVAGAGLVVPVELYVGAITACGISSALVWWYTRRTPGLLPPPASPEAYQLELFENLDLPVMGVCLVISFPFMNYRVAAIVMAFVSLGDTLGRRWLKRRARLQASPAL